MTAIDFDGTIVEYRYPKVGEETLLAIEILKTLAKGRHRLILWAVREGDLLKGVIEQRRQRGVSLYTVNRNCPEEKENHHGFSRKLRVDLFIDDRGLGDLPDWGAIYQMIHGQKPCESALSDRQKSAGGSNWIGKLFGKRNK